MIKSNWTSLLPKQVQEQFSKCGFYRYDYQPYTSGHRMGKNLVFIMLNTNLYYNNKRNLTEEDPCGQIQWLDEQLNDATRDPNNRIIISAHVPPGFFERDTSFGPYMGSDDNHVINAKYIETVNKYPKDPINHPGPIVAHIYGHTHTDSFRLFKDQDREGKPYSVGFIAPSITPNVNWVYTNQSWCQGLLLQ